jgi:hypothetical protein
VKNTKRHGAGPEEDDVGARSALTDDIKAGCYDERKAQAKTGLMLTWEWLNTRSLNMMRSYFPPSTSLPLPLPNNDVTFAPQTNPL